MEPVGTTALPDRSALIAYGSETGNAQDVAEDVFRLCERLRFSTRMEELDFLSLRDLLQFDLVVFVISTTGQGDLPANTLKFWRSLRSARLPPGCLQKLKFTSFGLGDSSYPQFNWAHKKLSNRLLQLGAQVICDRAESDEQHPEGVDGSFVPWLSQLRERLLGQYPLPHGIEPIGEDILLEPKWILQQMPGDENIISQDSSDRPPDGLLVGLPKGTTATVMANNRVTPMEHWQDVRHLSLRMEERHMCSPGDTLTVYPKNFPADVDQLLSICGWTSIADKKLAFVPTDRPQYEKDPESYPAAPVPRLRTSCFSLRELLILHLDVMSIPRRSFFSNLSHYASDEFQIERLKEFTNPEYIDELFDYTTRPRRSILEVLDEFTSVKIPWQKVCSIIPTIRGRQFSIASGGELKLVQQSDTGNEQQTRIELLIAIVKYRTIIKRIRQGVCTRYIAALQPGQRLTVTLQKGGLNPKQSDLEKPVVMVGPGTGVAPMRSLIYERIMWRKDKGKSVDKDYPDILFFGCRNEHSDYFFKEEWKELREQGTLSEFAAFSRDQRQKVYVQDLVRQQSKLVFRVIAEKGGMVYVCGASGKMPLAVREALLEVLEKEGRMERQDAEGYFTRMEKEGRYKQETW